MHASLSTSDDDHDRERFLAACTEHPILAELAQLVVSLNARGRTVEATEMIELVVRYAKDDTYRQRVDHALELDPAALCSRETRVALWTGGAS